MKDHLIDIVKHTAPLGVFKNLRVDGTDTETTFLSADENKLVVLLGKLHAPIKEFKGTFGIPSLSWLNVLLTIPEYQEDSSKCRVEAEIKNNVEQPISIKFENANSDYKNEFRLMTANLINNIQPLLKFNVTSWPIEFETTVVQQQRLKFQASSNPEETTATFSIEKGAIKVIIGDPSGSCGNFIFYNGVDPKIKENIVVPIALVNNILSLSGDKKIRIGNLGLMISIDSGLGIYDFIIPTLTK